MLYGPGRGLGVILIFCFEKRPFAARPMGVPEVPQNGGPKIRLFGATHQIWQVLGALQTHLKVIQARRVVWEGNWDNSQDAALDF